MRTRKTGFNEASYIWPYVDDTSEVGLLDSHLHYCLWLLFDVNSFWTGCYPIAAGFIDG